MFKTLYTKLAAVLLVIFFLLGVFLVVVINHSTQNLQTKTSQKLHYDLAKHIVYDMRLWEKKQLNKTTVEEAFHMMMVLGPSIELYVLDNEGRVVLYDAPENKIKLTKVNLAPIQHFINSKDDLPIVGDDPRSPDQKKIFSAAPIVDLSANSKTKSKQNGYLYIIIGGEQYDSIASSLQLNHAFRISILVVIISLLFALVAILLLFYNITKPIRSLSTEIQKFQASDSRELPNIDLDSKQKNTDEITILRNSFYELAKKIVSQIKNLEAVDEQRRELFAHISHDLRTPLAGLQGYLETLLLKGDAISSEQREHFINTAIRQAHQLSKLIDNLFELTRLEGKDINLYTEPFKLCELTGDVVQQTQVIAKEKNIHLTVHCKEHIPEVQADIGKVERVMCNLIDNAIHYTPAGGQVDVNIYYQQNNHKVRFEVCDTGPGIAEEDMPYIFDPYFRSSKTAQQYRKGGGLGLAISQRLLALHNTSLIIKSQLQQGTQAYFELDADIKNKKKSL